jgi:hypothetical protein
MRTYQHYAGYKSGYWDTMQQLGQDKGSRMWFLVSLRGIVNLYSSWAHENNNENT